MHLPMDGSARSERNQGLLRELKRLEGQRRGEGVDPLGYLRWLDLRERLAARLGQDPVDPGEKAHRSRLRVVYRDPVHLARHAIRNLPRGGLFVSTPFVADVGTEFDVRVRVQSLDRVFTLPAVVVSNGVGDGFSTQNLGMGLHWAPAEALRKGEFEAVLEEGRRRIEGRA